MMKITSKRRRTKVEIKEEKLKAQKHQEEVDAKVAQYHSLSEEVEDLRR